MAKNFVCIFVRQFYCFSFADKETRTLVCLRSYTFPKGGPVFKSKYAWLQSLRPSVACPVCQRQLEMLRCTSKSSTTSRRSEGRQEGKKWANVLSEGQRGRRIHTLCLTSSRHCNSFSPLTPIVCLCSWLSVLERYFSAHPFCFL